MSGSKFAGLAAARKTVEPETQNSTQAPMIEAQTQRKMGRPTGKRSDPDCTQVTAYIGKATHKAVKRTLLDDDEERDFSELIEELLQEWLKRNA